MDVTFITIHGKSYPGPPPLLLPLSLAIADSRVGEDLSRDASILYASDSIQVVLGFQPLEVLNRSAWDYFHPQELQFARSVHGRGVRLDKAAVLNYCSIRHKNGSWVGCECVFTVVYDVLIASTTVYGRGRGSQKRAIDAPIVRQLFDSSPNDPRYHMLTWISDKFSRRLVEPLHEPRAALFVNRFTRTATIMYATSGVTEILGLSPHQLISKSFFYCIQERCLRDAVRCLESAKANDSIAYLRFWFRNPLLDDDVDTDMSGYSSPAFGIATDPFARAPPPIELEAVVSCTSDGLVVILRRARAPIPSATLPPQPVPVYSNGIFAAPWALEPVYAYGTATYPHDNIQNPAYPEAKDSLCRENEVPSLGQTTTPASSLQGSSNQSYPATAKDAAAGGPQNNLLMDTIRDVAVFAWGIIGINRSLEQHKYGSPSGNAHPDAMVDDSWDNDAAAGRG
ncbi:uncharacterized protein N7473_005820 [Penicillium subrubescens]|uniref:uncharacterized protein n=1 Tax=Penicillium subrubescens TaxID=1316194 RepID=UPI00254515FD|nr:uncharacterized protein N7473_005820 [Penicillium subrubescens]KAJ5896421.1 hypothetical protein N7473_005820 [Penicillium subrubescens]